MHVEPSFQHVARNALSKSLEELAKVQGYPGPLGRLDKAEFLQANEPWLGNTPPEPGARHIGRITSVKKRRANVQLGEGVHGTLKLKATKWAGPYKALKGGGQGGSRKKGKVSFKPKLRIKKSFREGDVILVECSKASGFFELALVPVPIVEGASSAANHGEGIDVAVEVGT